MKVMSKMVRKKNNDNTLQFPLIEQAREQRKTYLVNTESLLFQSIQPKFTSTFGISK